MPMSGKSQKKVLPEKGTDLFFLHIRQINRLFIKKNKSVPDRNSHIKKPLQSNDYRGSDLKPGSDLLSHGNSHTIIGAKQFHFRVRDGIGWFPLANAARQTVRKSDEKGDRSIFPVHLISVQITLKKNRSVPCFRQFHIFEKL